MAFHNNDIININFGETSKPRDSANDLIIFFCTKTKRCIIIRPNLFNYHSWSPFHIPIGSYNYNLFLIGTQFQKGT